MIAAWDAFSAPRPAGLGAVLFRRCPPCAPRSVLAAFIIWQSEWSGITLLSGMRSDYRFQRPDVCCSGCSHAQLCQAVVGELWWERAERGGGSRGSPPSCTCEWPIRGGCCLQGVSPMYTNSTAGDRLWQRRGHPPTAAAGQMVGWYCGGCVAAAAAALQYARHQQVATSAFLAQKKWKTWPPKFSPGSVARPPSAVLRPPGAPRRNIGPRWAQIKLFQWANLARLQPKKRCTGPAPAASLRPCNV